MKSATDYRIERIRAIVYNGRQVKAFDVFEKQGDAFIFVGAYTAPVRTANKHLWLIPNERDTGSVE